MFNRRAHVRSWCWLDWNWLIVKFFRKGLTGTVQRTELSLWTELEPLCLFLFSHLWLFDLYWALRIAYNLNLYFIINSTWFLYLFINLFFQKLILFSFNSFIFLFKSIGQNLDFFICIINQIQSLICLLSPNQSHSNLAFSFFFHIKFYSSNQFLIIVSKIFKFLNRALQGLTGKAGIYN